jgi:hypothetical protein
MVLMRAPRAGNADEDAYGRTKNDCNESWKRKGISDNNNSAGAWAQLRAA